jgi:hypothetical protein
MGPTICKSWEKQVLDNTKDIKKLKADVEELNADVEELKNAEPAGGGLTNLLSEPVFIDTDLTGYEWSNTNSPDMFNPSGVTKSQAIQDILTFDGDEKPYMITIVSDYATFAGAALIVINGYGAITAPHYIMAEYGYYATVQVGIQNGYIYTQTSTGDPLKVTGIYKLC